MLADQLFPPVFVIVIEFVNAPPFLDQKTFVSEPLIEELFSSILALTVYGPLRFSESPILSCTITGPISTGAVHNFTMPDSMLVQKGQSWFPD